MPDSETKININLIGYRCSGKSSVGRQLAEVMARPFVDADLIFVEQEGRSVTEFVAASGWPEFRQVESRILGELCRKEEIVLATGGGVVLKSENRFLLKESGLNFWLQIEPETVFTRLAADSQSASQRPPLSSLSPADEISVGLKEREPFYREIADYIIPVDQLSIAEIVTRILRYYQERRV
ncbi:MAG TPA: shikimate kinase [Desulfarculaceae bacterium]|nr:shikimate kinase [Desulfarculaceae bacterium]